MADLKTHTKVLALFCMLVFFNILLPANYESIGSVLTIFVLVLLVIVLYSYYQILEKLESNEKLSIESETRIDTVHSHSADTHEMYNKLKEIIFNLSKSVILESKSAFYIFDPEKQAFHIQTENSTEFKDLISADNVVFMKHLIENKKLHQKDFPDVWENLFFEQPWRGSECAIFSPIHLDKSVIGLIATRVDHFTEITDNQINILNKLSSLVSFSLESLNHLEKSVLAEQNKSLILDIIDKLDFKSDSQNIFNQFKYLIRTFFKFERLTISLKKETENRRKLDRGINSIIKLTDGLDDDFDEGDEFPTNGSIHGLPTIDRKIINSVDWPKNYPNMFRFNSAENDDYNLKSILGVPIIIDGESRGSILLERSGSKPFSINNEEDLGLMGNVLGSALHWRYEYEKIHNNATHDGLSGLLNHQTFKERFSDEILRAARFQQKMAIMIFDLDKFKKVNDTLGHQYGDYVIQAVSKIMQDNVRAVDVVARYGGEEFAVILINSNVEMSNIVAQRIVDNIADFNFTLDGIETKITISGGMSEYPTHSDNTKDLIELADQAMYRTKQEGGNGIITHINTAKDNE